MNIVSRLSRRFDTGLLLELDAEGMPMRAYVAISPPDPEAVTAFIPTEEFENDIRLHVAAVTVPGEAVSLVEDVLFNMDPDDTVAFLCANAECWWATLEELGYVPDGSPLE